MIIILKKHNKKKNKKNKPITMMHGNHQVMNIFNEIINNHNFLKRKEIEKGK